MPVGHGERLEQFILFTLDHHIGDLIYLYTDGFADQFGGPNGKKLMYKPFKKMLLNIWKHPMPKQKEELLTKFYF